MFRRALLSVTLMVASGTSACNDANFQGSGAKAKAKGKGKAPEKASGETAPSGPAAKTDKGSATLPDKSPAPPGTPPTGVPAANREVIRIGGEQRVDTKPVEIIAMVDKSNSMANHLEKLKASLHTVPERLSTIGVPFRMHLISMQDLTYDATTQNYNTASAANVLEVPKDLGVFESGDASSVLTDLAALIRIDQAAILDRDQAIPYYNQPGLCAAARYLLAQDEESKAHRFHLIALTDENNSSTIEVASPNDSAQKRNIALNCLEGVAATPGGEVGVDVAQTYDFYYCAGTADTCQQKALAAGQQVFSLTSAKYCKIPQFYCKDMNNPYTTTTCPLSTTYNCPVFVDGQPTTATESISYSSYLQRLAQNKAAGCTATGQAIDVPVETTTGLTGCQATTNYYSASVTVTEKDANATRYVECIAQGDREAPAFDVNLAGNVLASVTPRACPAGYTEATRPAAQQIAYGICASELVGKTLPPDVASLKTADSSTSATNTPTYAYNATEKAQLDARPECTFQQTYGGGDKQGGGNGGNGGVGRTPDVANVQAALMDFDLTWHAIIAQKAERCPGETTGDISIGTDYQALVGTTGTQANICDPNYEAAVGAMTEKIVAQSIVEAYMLKTNATSIVSVKNLRTGQVLTPNVNYTSIAKTITFLDSVAIGDEIEIVYQ